jgi:simple sugar transport system substrate-binding protein
MYDNPPPLPFSTSRVCGDEGCRRRSTIRLAAVLHGTSTSLFWKPLVQAVRQTAFDLGISLEMEIRDAEQSQDLFFAKMGYRIRSACESNVDGIIVSIPNEVLLDALRFCQSLQVPIISVNAGAEFAKELGVMAHIGQDEFNAGYGGGQRLVREGMKEGYCLVHSDGNVALLDRCRGMEAAIAEAEGVIYRGYVVVSGDDIVHYKVNVETAVAERSGDPDPSWDGIGLLSLTTTNVDAALHVLDAHPKAILGTFDVGDRIYGPLAEGRLKFGIDQQPLLQGIMPVYLLTYAAYTKQQLSTSLVETGPHFQDQAPTPGQEVCESTFFSVCKELPEEEMNLIPRL